MVQADTTQDNTVRLHERLGKAHIGLRNDLEIHRHLNHGEPYYVVRDPLSLQCYQFNLKEYLIFCQLTPALTLAEIFQILVEKEWMNPEDQEPFFKFVLNLHQLNFLQLPISSDKALYRRHIQRQKAQRMQKLFSLFFLQIPLLNPDNFLEKTAHLVRPLFTRVFFIIYLILLGGSAALTVRHFGEIQTFSGSLFSAGNMAILWISLILLKAIHELGHGYACKLFGGQVTDMGVYLIMLTPCAYVDVTSSWGFNSKIKRIIVGLGGVYFESMIAMIALLVWCASESYSTRMLAYNIFFLASVTTLLMNVNPLMRFDGYYILSDLLEMPNLRSRSRDYLVRVCKRLFLRIKSNEPGPRGWMAFFLLTFGIFASIYKVSIVLALSWVIARKMLIFGLALAGLYIAMTVFSILTRITVYLRKSPEASRYRWRTSIAALLFLMIVPAAIVYMPIPCPIRAEARLIREHEQIIRTRQSGFVKRVLAQTGDRVEAATPIMELDNHLLHEKYLDARNRLTQARKLLTLYQSDSTIDPVEIAQQLEIVTRLTALVQTSSKDLEQLNVRTDSDGTLIDCPQLENAGYYVQPGEEVARLADGNWQCEAWIHQKDVIEVQEMVGKKMVFRSAMHPRMALTGTLVYVSPAPVDYVHDLTLTTAGQGSLPIDPLNGRVLDTYHKIVINLDGPVPEGFQYGSTGMVAMKGRNKSLGLILYRKLIRFIGEMDLENQA